MILEKAIVKASGRDGRGEQRQSEAEKQHFSVGRGERCKKRAKLNHFGWRFCVLCAVACWPQKIRQTLFRNNSIV